MFSGIIETLGKVKLLKKEKGNLHITVEASLSKKLKIDQSIAHNGACLTVVKKNKKNHTVTAIKETLRKTNLGKLKTGDVVNLERAVKLKDRIDGHIVQGHIDTTAVCESIKKQKGSWVFEFRHKKAPGFVTVEKGSVCVNGVSLTVIDSAAATFSVAIIPYTFDHTNFKNLKKGSLVNIEFDILGKYVVKIMASRA